VTTVDPTTTGRVLEGAALPVRPTATRRRRGRSGASDLSVRGKLVRYALLSLAAVVTIFPFYAMVVLSLKPAAAIDFPASLLPTNLTTEAYGRVLGAGNIGTWLVNTLVYSVVSVVAVLLLASMAGYAFAKKKFPGREAMFWSFLAMVMVPYHVTLIPTFILIAQAGGLDTYWGLILPTLANAQAVFLIRQFVMDMPDELFDAARIDGAGEWRTFVSIVLPLIKPVLATLAIFVFLWHWNDLLWPLVVGQSDEARTLTVGLATLNTETVSTSNIMAAALISFVPCFLIFIFLQRHIVESITASGIKG